jgi:hypothetical protein
VALNGLCACQHETVTMARVHAANRWVFRFKDLTGCNYRCVGSLRSWVLTHAEDGVCMGDEICAERMGVCRLACAVHARGVHVRECGMLWWHALVARACFSTLNGCMLCRCGCDWMHGKGFTQVQCAGVA